MVVMDGEKTSIPCGKPSRRKDLTLASSRLACDNGYMDGCCEDCVTGLRNDVGLTEMEIEALYPEWAEAIHWYDCIKARPATADR